MILTKRVSYLRTNCEVQESALPKVNTTMLCIVNNTQYKHHTDWIHAKQTLMHTQSKERMTCAFSLSIFYTYDIEPIIMSYVRIFCSSAHIQLILGDFILVDVP